MTQVNSTKRIEADINDVFDQDFLDLIFLTSKCTDPEITGYFQMYSTQIPFKVVFPENYPFTPPEITLEHNAILSIPPEFDFNWKYVFNKNNYHLCEKFSSILFNVYSALYHHEEQSLDAQDAVLETILISSLK